MAATYPLSSYSGSKDVISLVHPFLLEQFWLAYKKGENKDRIILDDTLCNQKEQLRMYGV